MYHNADMLYHEATFMNKEEARSLSTFHSTARQAASLAKEAKVKKLLLGHFSTRYQELNQLLEEAKAVFPNTQLAVEGQKFQL
jgi:ribonuclease Z